MIPWFRLNRKLRWLEWLFDTHKPRVTNTLQAEKFEGGTCNYYLRKKRLFWNKEKQVLGKHRTFSIFRPFKSSYLICNIQSNSSYLICNIQPNSSYLICNIQSTSSYLICNIQSTSSYLIYNIQSTSSYLIYSIQANSSYLICNIQYIATSLTVHT